MKKLLSLLLAAVLLSGCAWAELPYAPDPEEYWTEAALEDFVGGWSLIMIRSDEAVDMLSYRDLDVYPDASAALHAGGREDSLYFEGEAEMLDNGMLYFADQKGAHGAYYFLFDTTLMGCVETLDNPSTVEYLELSTAFGEEEDQENELAAEILSLVGETLQEPAAQAFCGSWKCWAYTGDAARQVILDPAMATLELTLQADQAQVYSTMYGEDTRYTSPVDFSGAWAVITDEYGEDPLYLALTGEDSLVLLDDPDEPSYAMFFLSARRWAEEEASGAFDTSLKVGDAIALSSPEEAAGLWQATHVNYGGVFQSLDSMGLCATLEIAPDGTMVLNEEGDLTALTGRIENGDLIAREKDGYERHFRLFEGGVLMEAGDSGNFSLSVCYQRAEEE